MGVDVEVYNDFLMFINVLVSFHEVSKLHQFFDYMNLIMVGIYEISFIVVVVLYVLDGIF
jgi:hypothetical protein